MKLQIKVTIDGPDAKQALTDLLSIIEYDKLNVNLAITEITDGNKITTKITYPNGEVN